MTEYNVQQKQFIQEYKTRHHLENKSDEQIMLFIQKDMQTNGVVYLGFENLVKPQNKSAYTGQIFGNSTASNDMAGITVEKSTTTAIKESEKEITTDENGNEVAVVKNGDEVVEATITNTDSNGNKLETVVSYENGKPVKQIKKQNGNVSSVTKFTYNEPTENMPFPSVTVETIDGGKNKIITTALETDKYGNVDQEDFIRRKTISRDGTETTVIIGSEYIKEEKLKFDGKKVTTLYKGTNLADFDSHKLHRVVQETEVDGIKRYAEYDGKGNTKTTVQFGETPSKIAKKFNVKEQALMRLNPQKGKNAITQVAADILIPGEFNADSYPMRVRKSKGESLNKYNQFEARRLTKEINSGEVQNIKLAKSYNNVYEFAKDKLLKSGVKNLDNDQINEEANKLILLNGENFSYKAGKTVKVAKSLTNSKQASELTKYGFQASAENRIFFQKFNALNPQQKQNVLSAIQYCKSQKITNPSDIKAKVLETLGINLFDSAKTVPMVADNNYGVMAYQRNSKPISIETFVKNHLKLDIKSEPGKTVLDRLSQAEQTKLNKISAKDFKGFNNKTLDSVASMLETVGVQIRTQAEINVKNNTPRAKAEKEKRAVRTAAAENIALAYDNAINVIKNYQGNQGWMNVAFYREKLGQLLDKVNPTDVATCFDAVIKRLEKEKQFAVSRLKTASANESEFKQAFKDLTGKDYNENAVKNFLAQAQKGGDWSKSYDQAFGDKVVKRATDKVNFQQYVDGAGDIVLMLLGTEAIGKGVAWAGGKVATKLSPYVPKVLSKLGAKGIMTIGNSTVTVGKVVGNMATSAATFTTWDATKNYINLKTKDIQYTGEDAVKEWQAYKEGNVESGKFGAFAGLLNSTVVGKVVNGTMKLFEKPVAKAMQGVAKTLEKGEATGADVMKTFMAKQTPGLIAQTAGAVAEVAGFTMYETANNLTKKLLQTDANGQIHLPKDLTEDGLTQYLLKNIPEELWKQTKGIGEIKAISKLIFMHKGAVVERERMMSENLAKCEMLGKVKIQKAEVDGAEIYAITTPNGNRKIARSPEDVVAYCNVLMQMDMAMNSKTAATETNPNETKVKTPKGLVEKTQTTSPVENVKNKVISEVAKDIKDEGMRLNTPESLDAELAEAEQNPNAPVDNMEAFNLVINGNIGNVLKAQYDNASNVFKDIAKKYSSELDQLEKQYGNDKKLFAEKFTEFLADKLGVKGIEPKIVLRNTGDADGFFDWSTGELAVNSKLNNSKDIQTMIAHEFVHVMQFKDMIANKGSEAVSSLLMHDEKFITAKAIELAKNNGADYKSLPAEDQQIYKEACSEMLADEVMEANKGLVDFAQKHPTSKGSLNEYLSRIYQNEYENMKTDVNSPEYYNQVIENEAYYLGNGQLGLNLKGSIHFTDTKASTPTNKSGVNVPNGVVHSEIKLKENNSLTPEETKSNLLELGFTPEEIANIDCENKGVQAYSNVVRAMISELKVGSSDDLKDAQARKGLIEEALNADEEFLNTAIFKYLNKENVNTLKQYITDFNDFEDCKHLFSSLEDCKYLDLLVEKIPLISKLCNNKLSIEDFQNYAFGYDYKLQNLDENSATKISEYNKLLPEEYQFRLFDIDRLTEENLSLEIVQSYAKECKRFKEIGLYEYSDSHSTIAEQTMQMKKIADMLEQYKLNFKYKASNGKEYSLGNSTLIDIANSNNIKEKVEFLNSLTPEGRALGVRYLNAPTTIPKESFVSFLNKLSKLENISFDRKDEIVKMLYSEDMKNHADFTDYIIELTENTSVLKVYDWKEYCLVANQDYKGAKNLLNELKIYFNDNKQFDNYINYNFHYICQNKDIDYTRAIANIKEMENRNLSVDAQCNLNTVIRSSNKDAVDIVELLDKAGFHESSLVRDLLSDKNISLSKINEKLDIVKAEIRKRYPDLKDIDDNSLLQYINTLNYNNEYYLFHAIKNDSKTIDDINAMYGNGCTGISYLNDINENNKQLFKTLIHNKEFPKDKIAGIVRVPNKDILVLAEKLCTDKEFPKDKIAGIIGATNKDNLVLAEKLCTDKEFPKDKIADIVSWTDKDNLAFVEKLCADKEFPKDQIAGIVRATNKDNLAFAEKLYTDKEFPKDKIADIVEATNKDNLVLAEKLCANKEIPLEHLSKILRSTNQLNADIVIDFCKTYNNYGFSADRIIDFVPHLKDINFENMQTLRTKISENAYQKMSASEFVILTNNMELVSKTSVESLLKSEKYNLINILLANKSKICEDKLLNIKEASPIFPTGEVEYAERMKELSNSLNISFDKLTPQKQAKFDNSIGALSNGVKEMNLADLSEINLKYSQKEFINNINELLKDLPTEEQIKLQNKFGFRIIDNKLTGYPKTVKDINVVDFENKELLNKVNEKVDSFLNNNALTVKDNPQLNSLLNDLFNNCPEILNQIDGSPEFANTIKRLQTIVNRQDFKTLSDSDQKIIVLATLVENTDKSINTSKDTAFDAFFIGQKYGLSDNEAKKLYYIVESGSSVETFMQTTKDETIRNYRGTVITGQDRQDKFDMMALNLKEDNRLKMTQMLYSSKYPEGFTRNFDKALENRVNEIKSQDFILPQTPSETYQEYATPTEITRDDNKYNVNIVKAEDIPNLYAFVHTPEAKFATGGSRAANFANFEAFATLNDDKVICTSYVSADKAGLVKEFHKGFIFEVQNDKQYVAYGRDIYSLGKNIQDIVVEYYRDKGFKAGQNKGDKYDHRTLMSNIMKQMLFGKDYYQMSKDVVIDINGIKTRYDSKLQELKKQRQSIIKNTFGTDNITNAQYRELKSNVDFVNIEKQMKDLRNQELAEIENIPAYKELKDMDNKYIARLDNVKAKLGNKPMTLDNIRAIDTELADAYKAFLDKDGANKVEHDNSASLLRSSWHNEALVSNPKITGIFTDNIEKLPEEYLIKAQEENLPIVIFDVSK